MLLVTGTPQERGPEWAAAPQRMLRLWQRRRRQVRTARGDDILSNAHTLFPSVAHINCICDAKQPQHALWSKSLQIQSITTFPQRATGLFSSTVAPASRQSAYSSSDRSKQEIKRTQNPGTLKLQHNFQSNTGFRLEIKIHVVNDRIFTYPFKLEDGHNCTLN